MNAFGPQWIGPGTQASPAVLVAAGATAVVAAATLVWERPGVGWVITGAVGAVATASVAVRRRGALLAPLAWAVAAVALLGVGAVRDAGWLFALCLPAAAVCVALSAAGGRSVRGLLLGLAAVPIAAVRAQPWAARGLNAARGRATASFVRTLMAAAVSFALLLVFGALFAGADPAFAAVLDDVLPTVDSGVLTRWAFTFLGAFALMVGICFLALAPPSFDGEPSRPRSLRRIEWALPVGALVVLFLSFVVVQATVLFGGGDHVLRTAGLTYAQYARGGFWQLSAITVLALLVIGVAARLAARETGSDRIWLRGLLGALAVLALVVVASALSRMWAYEQAYGYTRLRVLVSACELWLGVVFILVLVAGIRLRAPAIWLPRAVVGTAVAALLGIAAANPDGFIAERNVARYHDIQRIDLAYLQGLSADAVPALSTLPEPLRTCALRSIAADLREAQPQQWREWNLARERARLILLDSTPDEHTVCWNITGVG